MLIATLTLCSLGAHAAEPCLGPSPREAAEAFYKKHQDFASKDPKLLRGQVSKRFHEALAYEHACAVGEICAIGFDLWTGAQDGEVRKPITFQMGASSDTKAVVSMSYAFVLGPSSRRTQSATLQLERETPAGCWLVADVVSPDGVSALRLIEDFRAQYGGRP